MSETETTALAIPHCIRIKTIDEVDYEKEDEILERFEKQFFKDFDDDTMGISQYFGFDNPKTNFSELELCEACAEKIEQKYANHKQVKVRSMYQESVIHESYPAECMLCWCDLQSEVADKECPEELCNIETEEDLAAWEAWNEARQKQQKVNQ